MVLKRPVPLLWVDVEMGIPPGGTGRDPSHHAMGFLRVRPVRDHIKFQIVVVCAYFLNAWASDLPRVPHVNKKVAGLGPGRLRASDDLGVAELHEPPAQAVQANSTRLPGPIGRLGRYTDLWRFSWARILTRHVSLDTSIMSFSLKHSNMSKILPNVAFGFPVVSGGLGSGDLTPRLCRGKMGHRPFSKPLIQPTN